MFDFEKEKENEFDAIGFEKQRKSLKVGKQIGRTNIKRDVTRKALAPGHRISKNGNIYFENRKNRSDQPGKKI